MNRIVLIVVALCAFLSGCVATSEDLETRAQDIDELVLDRFDAAAQVLQETVTLQRDPLQLRANVNAAVRDKQLPAPQPSSGVPWGEIITGAATLLLGIPGSVAATNVVRDRKRKKRGEPVAVRA